MDRTNECTVSLRIPYSCLMVSHLPTQEMSISKKGEVIINTPDQLYRVEQHVFPPPSLSLPPSISLSPSFSLSLHITHLHVHVPSSSKALTSNFSGSSSSSSSRVLVVISMCLMVSTYTSERINRLVAREKERETSTCSYIMISACWKKKKREREGRNLGR